VLIFAILLNLSAGQTNEVRVSPDQTGQTVAAVVRALSDGMSWSQARALCYGGRVEIDGVVVRDAAKRVVSGDRLRILDSAATRSVDPAVPEAKVSILHVDRDVVVVDKPAGLSTVPFEPGEHGTLLHEVQRRLRKRPGRCPPLRVVQRLDKDTSGVLVFARSRNAERGLQEQFRAHTVDRRYVGVALGIVRPTTHQSFLLANRGDGIRGSFRGRKPPADARHAVTHVDCVATFEVPRDLRTTEAPLHVSIVACRLETGRQHQIRIHLAESGHPLVGEKVYVRDYPADRGFVRGFEPGSGRTLLHAERLGFLHPAREEPMAFEVDPPSDFEELQDRLRRSSAGWTRPGHA